MQVYVHVDESLHGMEVIKAFSAVNYFIQENVQRINAHHLALFNTEQCHLWLAFWWVRGPAVAWLEGGGGAWRGLAGWQAGNMGQMAQGHGGGRVGWGGLAQPGPSLCTQALTHCPGLALPPTRCDFFGAILVVATCLFSVGLKEDLGSAAVGLAISNTIQVRPPRPRPPAQPPGWRPSRLLPAHGWPRSQHYGPPARPLHMPTPS